MQVSLCSALGSGTPWSLRPAAAAATVPQCASEEEGLGWGLWALAQVHALFANQSQGLPWGTFHDVCECIFCGLS